MARWSPEKSRPSFFWLMAGLGWLPSTLMFKYDIQGELPRTGPFILTPNHYSDIDPVVVGFGVWKLGRAPRFMAKASLFKIPVVGWFLRRSGQIPVERGRGHGNSKRAALEAAQTLVDHGRGVIVYPEGTLTREPNGWPMRGKSGAIRLALAGDIPIIPVATTGADRLVPRFQKKFRFRLRTPIVMRVGEPISVRELVGERDDRATIDAATAQVMREITKLLEQIRGETAPAELYDPVRYGQTEFGMPTADPKRSEIQRDGDVK